jgi:NAD(P)-dependent dehydrogenase (short-subunit alcohol dehydrogenase family)
LGPINVLINNAGIALVSSLDKTTRDTWRDDIAINLTGAYHVTTAVLDDMKAGAGRGLGGAIVNVSSVNGLTALGDPAYSAAKAGLISYTKSLAMEYGPLGIRANAICPGTVRTPIWDERIKSNPNVMDDLKKWYPLGRVADPKDVAKAAAFLASDDAAAITGAVLPVDCGLTAGNAVMARELTVADY